MNARELINKLPRLYTDGTFAHVVICPSGPCPDDCVVEIDRVEGPDDDGEVVIYTKPYAEPEPPKV